MKQYTITEYDYNDMKKLQHMSLEELKEELESIQTGWFDEYIHVNGEDSFKTYSESEYQAYKRKQALWQAIDLIDDLIKEKS